MIDKYLQLIFRKIMYERRGGPRRRGRGSAVPPLVWTYGKSCIVPNLVLQTNPEMGEPKGSPRANRFAKFCAFFWVRFAQFFFRVRGSSPTANPFAEPFLQGSRGYSNFE